MTVTRSSIIDGSVEFERGRPLQAKFERPTGRNTKGGRSLSTAATFIPMARPAPIRTMPSRGAADNRPEAVTRAPCSYCATRAEYGCAHQKPYREDPADV